MDQPRRGSRRVEPQKSSALILVLVRRWGMGSSRKGRSGRVRSSVGKSSRLRFQRGMYMNNSWRYPRDFGTSKRSVQGRTTVYDDLNLSFLNAFYHNREDSQIAKDANALEQRSKRLTGQCSMTSLTLQGILESNDLHCPPLVVKHQRNNEAHLPESILTV